VTKPAPSPAMRSKKALEMVMRDVRDGLEQAAWLSGYDPGFDDLEILSIEAATTPSDARAPVYPLPRRRSSSVLEFLLAREMRHRA